MKVLVEFAVGDKAHEIQGEAPIFDNMSSGSYPLTDAAIKEAIRNTEYDNSLDQIGFFVYEWQEVIKSTIGGKHEGWCFIPWDNCFVQLLKAVPAE